MHSNRFAADADAGRMYDAENPLYVKCSGFFLPSSVPWK